MEALFFYGFGALALVSALGLWVARDAVVGVLCFLAVQVALAGICVLLEAHLLAAILVAVYCGSVAVLFLFAILLLGSNSAAFAKRGGGSLATAGLGASAVVALLWLWWVRLGWRGGAESGDAYAAPVPEGFGGFAALGTTLYDTYLVPVELAGVLLLAALVGAMILARWRVD